MDKYLKNLPIDIMVYEGLPDGFKEYADTSAMKKWLNSVPRELSFKEYYNDLLNVSKELNFNINMINKEIIRFFWEKLKNQNYVTSNGLIPEEKDLYELTKKLSYVYPVNVAKGLEGVSRSGIQLFPKPTEENLWTSMTNS